MNSVKEARESSQLFDELERIIQEQDEQIKSLHKQIEHLIAEAKLAKPESINHAAWHWHNLYQAKCQEFHDKQTMLGTEIVALEEELAELKEEQLAKPEQEPEPTVWVTDEFAITYTADVAQRWRDKGWKVVPFYTAPPRKPWVDLSSTQIDELIYNANGLRASLVLETMHKLKELNG